MVSVPKPNKIFNKVLERADVIGGGIGLWENLGGISGMATHIQGLITHPVGPNWYTVWDEVGLALGMDIGIVIAGVIGETVSEGMGYSKYFRALSKFGVGKIMGNILGSVIANSHNPGRGGTSTVGASNVWTVSRQGGAATTSGNLPKPVPQTVSMLPSS